MNIDIKENRFVCNWLIKVLYTPVCLYKYPGSSYPFQTGVHSLSDGDFSCEKLTKREHLRPSKMTCNRYKCYKKTHNLD